MNEALRTGAYHATPHEVIAIAIILGVTVLGARLSRGSARAHAGNPPSLASVLAVAGATLLVIAAVLVHASH